jgi:predicted HD phosphohydrolase
VSQVAFQRMKDGTADEYRLLHALEETYAADLPARLVAALQRLDTSLEGYQVSRLTHSLQTATRAERDGADAEMVAAALVHDLGDELAPWNHAAFAAEIVRPYVRPQVTWIVAQHGIFQMYYYAHHVGGDRQAREALRGHAWFEDCAAFCENWDQASFDPTYNTLPLSHFEPLLRDVFAKVRDRQA